MPSLRITKFGGINLEVATRLAMPYVAQTAHNCLLWDGALRPLAKWRKVLPFADATTQSIDVDRDGITIRSSVLKDAVFMKSVTYPAETKVGISNQPIGLVSSNIFYQNRYTVGEGKPVGLHKPIITQGGVSFSRQFKSDKPVNRIYGLTGLRINGNTVEESVLSVIPGQSPQSIVYEGDLAMIHALVASPDNVPYDGFRLYRTISGMDVGAAVQNELDTEWHLVAEFRGSMAMSYSDGGSATNDPLDVYLAGNFYPPPPLDFDFLALSEGGWLVAATENGTIIASERYLLHAYPTENMWQLPGEEITDMVAHFDNVFIGTTNNPYILAISAGEKLGTQGAITPFPEKYECQRGTMDRTPAGAVYVSPSGVVTLSREGMKLLSAGVARGVADIRKISNRYEVIDPDTQVKTEYSESISVRFTDTRYGAYYHGLYFGFCASASKEYLDNPALPEQTYVHSGFIFDTGSNLDGEHPLAKFTTMDVPIGVRAHTTGGTGLYVLAEDGVYSMPFPDSQGRDVYSVSEKYCYTWKSRKYVFPGQMCAAAAKIVHDCGPVKLRIYVDCCCVYETVVNDCKPFTLPPNLVGVEWEVELEGKATVHEIHLASSLRELLEHERYGDEGG